ncbi:hypothetical protein E4Z66_15085 [Aliishimia ponticola]|uniref:Uncharacterized protein n=1 Tax=Aliishimia ponticola TaxID=2499833 RepID=A0A4S4N7L8_9RHOB|nr:hypothetical protein [Aliishimia ponticola]THH35146.1 hypothetical protein E4Z66_15085 [Aliishimia ponticola]
MTLLRPIFVALMITLMLPWGAYLKAQGAVMRAAELPTQAITQDQGDAVAFSAPRTRISNAGDRKRCRTGILPGAACAIFADLSQDPQTEPPFGDASALRPEQGIWVRDVPTSPDTGPPRRV